MLSLEKGMNRKHSCLMLANHFCGRIIISVLCAQFSKLCDYHNDGCIPSVTELASHFDVHRLDKKQA